MTVFHGARDGDDMTPEGFYHVVWDGFYGAGYCRHYDSLVRGEKYETWDLIFIRNVPGDQKGAAKIYTNSTDTNFARLQVGERIRGLP